MQFIVAQLRSWITINNFAAVNIPETDTVINKIFLCHIDEIKIVYNRYIKLMSDNKTIQINQTFIDYLKKISSYLLDGLRNKRTNTVNYKKIIFLIILLIFSKK